MTDKIITVRQPYASALVCGIKPAEYRSWRIEPGTRVWIHAGLSPDLDAAETADYLDSLGDPVAADYLRWMVGADDRPRPDISGSIMAQHMYASSGRRDGLALPVGVVIGWCIFGEARPTEGGECKFGRIANPVVDRHLLDPKDWRMHQGSLGLRSYGG